MQLLPLVLSCKVKSWRMDDAASEEADAGFQQVKKKVRERDQHTCRFCGFRQQKADYYMQVHHKDDDHHNNSMENLITACMHCHAVQHIGLWGSAGEAVLVYLPEWPQYYLNHVCRGVLVAKRFHAKMEADVKAQDKGGRGPSAPAALVERARAAKEMMERTQAIFERVRAREIEAESRLGTSDPADVANALLHAPDEIYARRAQSLAPYRLLLLGHHHPGGRTQSPIDKMTEIVDGWLSVGGPFVGLEPSNWSRLLQTV